MPGPNRSTSLISTAASLFLFGTNSRVDEFESAVTGLLCGFSLTPSMTNSGSFSIAFFCRRLMKNQNAMNDMIRTAPTGATIAGINVLRLLADLDVSAFAVAEDVGLEAAVDCAWSVAVAEAPAERLTTVAVRMPSE